MQLHVPLKKKAEGKFDRRGSNVALGAKSGLTQPWPKGKKTVAMETMNRFFPRASGGSTAKPIPWFQPCDTDSRLLASRTVREQISLVLRCQVCVNLLEQLQETDT